MNIQQGGGKAGGRIETMKVWYTAKDINATAGSRSAIASDLKVGYPLVLDPYAHDKGTSVIHATQPQSTFLVGQKFIVTHVPDEVNDIPDSGAATQRRGGFVTVAAMADEVLANCEGTIVPGVSKLVVQAGEWYLAVSTAVSTSVEIASFCGTAHDAATLGSNPTYPAGLKRIRFNPS